MTTQQYDALIIGAGQAGTPLSTALANAGWKTALVERKHIGGTCINEGCTPTKTMVASARVAYMARRAGQYGVSTGSVGVDMEAVRQRKRDVVDSFRTSNEQRVEEAPNLDYFFGDAQFTGPKTVEIHCEDGELVSLSGKYVFINTGARPMIPPIEGIDSIPVLDSTSIMELDTVPEHLLVLGGGYIGLEFGQMFRRFGSRVTIIQRGSQLLGPEDPDVADEVAGILRGEGIDILLKTQAKSVEQSGNTLRLTVKTSDSERVIEGTHLLAAAGRRPNTDTLNLKATDVTCDMAGFIRANDRLETSAPGIYALGDVKGGPAFTHISYDDFRVIRTNLLNGGAASTRDRLVPYTVFIDPQLGRIGLTETEARKQGRRVKVAKLPMDWVARALEMDETRGFLKAVVDEDTGLILGCAMLGIEGGELMAMVQLAMMGKLHYTTLRDAVFAHPTLAEALNNLFGRI